MTLWISVITKFDKCDPGMKIFLQVPDWSTGERWTVVLESTMVYMGNHEHVWNGDLLPAQLQAQDGAINIICH